MTKTKDYIDNPVTDHPKTKAQGFFRSSRRNRPIPNTVALGTPKDYRDALNMTQDALARSIGLTRRQWITIEQSGTLSYERELALRYLVLVHGDTEIRHALYKQIKKRMTTKIQTNRQKLFERKMLSQLLWGMLREP